MIVKNTTPDPNETIEQARERYSNDLIPFWKDIYKNWQNNAKFLLTTLVAPNGEEYYQTFDDTMRFVKPADEDAGYIAENGAYYSRGDYEVMSIEKQLAMGFLPTEIIYEKPPEYVKREKYLIEKGKKMSGQI